MAANAVFVAAEFALVALDEARLGDSRSAEGVRSLRKRLSFHLSGAQLGITATSLVLGFLAEPTIATLLEDLVGIPPGPAVLTALVVATLFQMLIGELVPKNLAIARPERTALRLGGLVTVYGIAFSPVIRSLDRLAEAVVRLLGVEPVAELSAVRSREELRRLFHSSAEHGTLAQESSRRLTRVSELADLDAADVLVPRVDVISLSADDSVSDLVQRSSETGFSRFPVHTGDLDEVVGVVHVRAAQTIPPELRAVTGLESLDLDSFVVPETAALLGLLPELRVHPMALVVDEYGGTAGIITLEDVVEVLVGDIGDEHDLVHASLTQPDRPGEHVVAGNTSLVEVRDQFGLEIPPGPYETLAGFVLDRLGRIPSSAGEKLRYLGWTLEVLEMDRNRIAALRLEELRATDRGSP